MLSLGKMPSRLAIRLPLLVAAATFFSLMILVWFSDSLSSPLDYAHAKAIEYVSHAPPAVRNCSDPYRRPGYLYIPQNKTDYNKTVYIPYSTEFLQAEDPEYAQFPAAQGEIVFNTSAPSTEFLHLKTNPTPWMTKAVLENRRRIEAKSLVGAQSPEVFLDMKEDAGFGWLWGRRVLMFSDSVERYMTQHFCTEFGSTIRYPISHESAKQAKVICEIPAFNLTLVYLHSPGSYTYKPDWWWIKQMKYVSFEERWDRHWKPHEESIQGPNGRPDLILWQNGLWDQRAFWEGGKATYPKDHMMAQADRQLQWEELRFVAARNQKIAQRLNDEFGEDAPIMFRSLTTYKNGGMRSSILLDLDRLGRAVAEQAGHEVFEWARIITLYSNLFSDPIHPGKGPATWLWGNMVLEYLARSAGAKVGGTRRAPYFDGWDACHNDLVNWGGR